MLSLKLPFDKKIIWGSGALLGLLFVSFISIFSFYQFTKSSQRVFRTLTKLDRVMKYVSDASLSGRGYVTMDSNTLVTPYNTAATSVIHELEALSRLVRDNPPQRERLSRLKPLVIQEFDMVRKIISLKKNHGTRVDQRIEGGQNLELMKKIQHLIQEMKNAEMQRLNYWAERTEKDGRHTIYFLLFANLIAFSITAASLFFLYRDRDVRHQVEDKFNEASKKLQVWVEDLEQRNSEFTVLSDTVDLLHTCVVVEEAYAAIAKSCQKLFPGMQGALYLIDEAKNLVEVATWWNGMVLGETVFRADDCWALRRGRIYEADISSGHVCGHLSGVTFDHYLCVPMIGQGAALGFLHLRHVSDVKINGATAQETISESKKRLILTFTEQTALALANLRLRQKLHIQSIHDPLTGLFNRRHMQDALERELRRSARGNKPLGLIMMDIDRFKKFNDLFGHEAGDKLLVEFGQHMEKQFREYDIPCRYGGEEFMVLMPETPIEIAQKRAEQLRKSMKNLQLQYKGEMLGPVSLSLGVAVYPFHGQTPENLFRAADAALYQAKADGRNCVSIAPANIP